MRKLHETSSLYVLASGGIMDPKLFEAAGAGDVSMLQTILQNDPAALHRVVMTSNRETPLHISALLGHLEFVKAVLARNPALACEHDEQGSSPLHLAVGNGHVQVVEELLKVGGGDLCLLRDNGGRLPLHVAALRGRADVLAKLISEKPESIREVAEGGDTVLHLSVRANQFQVVDYLVGKAGVNDMMNLQDENGNTILHLATARKQVQTTRLLLRSPGGIDVNATNRRGATALAVLLESPREHGDVQLEQILLAAGGKLETSPSLPQSHVVQIHPMPSSLRGNSRKEIQKHSKWLNDKRSTLMIVAVLIATITFEAALNPPGGYYFHQTDTTATSNNTTQLSSSPPYFSYEFGGRDGQAIIGNTVQYTCFMLFDVIGLSASLGIILLLTVIPMRRKLLMAILVRVMSVAIFATVMAFFYLALHIIPIDNCSARWVVRGFFWAWVVIMSVAVSSQLLQALGYLLKKFGLKMKKMYNIVLFMVISIAFFLGFSTLEIFLAYSIVPYL